MTSVLCVNPLVCAAGVCSGETADHQGVLRDVTATLRSEFGFSGATVQVERYSEGGSAGPWGAGPLAD